MKVTMKKWAHRGAPPLYDVLIDGQPIGGDDGHSRGRVLKSPWGWMPIHDDHGIPAILTFDKRSEAAEYVAQVHITGKVYG
jgi:hypothetical protein